MITGKREIEEYELHRRARKMEKNELFFAKLTERRMMHRIFAQFRYILLVDCCVQLGVWISLGFRQL